MIQFNTFVTVEKFDVFGQPMKYFFLPQKMIDAGVKYAVRTGWQGKLQNGRVLQVLISNRLIANIIKTK